MAKEIGIKTRRELVRSVGERYRVSSKRDKLHILNEFVAITGYHRKHAIRILNDPGLRLTTGNGSRPRLYDEAVRMAVIMLWEASDRVCGKRLKPLMPILIPALERHGHLKLEEGVRERLLSASAATIDRLLAEPRGLAGNRRCSRRPATAVRGSVPVRTFADWNEPLPGFMEADLVAHCGDTVAGSHAHSFVLTDITSGWTECVALAVRAGTLITEALTRLRETMPFPLRGIDTDNGSEFINEVLVAYCNEHGITFTRSRPYHKNDQAWVEQKNGSVVRRLIGYRRLEGIEAAQGLSRLYAASRLFVNFFQPSFKLAEKTRIGARVRKRYHPPATPCTRLLASEAIPESMKERLREVAMTIDPLQLLDEIRSVQHHLAGLASGEVLQVPRNPDLDRFFKSLATAWRDGEVRPTHQPEPKRRHDWRTRKDPFEAFWPKVCGWLDPDPDRTAKELFQRLQAEHPGVFPDGQLRTLQRKIKEWRSTAARRLVFAGHVVETASGVSNTIRSFERSIESGPA